MLPALVSTKRGMMSATAPKRDCFAVDVDQLARIGALGADHRRARLEGAQAAQPQAAQHRPTVETGRWSVRAMAGSDKRWRRRASMAACWAGHSRVGLVCGLDERSARPAGPCCR